MHKVLFEPSEHLWWLWALILNPSLPLLPSCWGFSFALGCGVFFLVLSKNIFSNTPKKSKVRIFTYPTTKSFGLDKLWIRYLRHHFLFFHFLFGNNFKPTKNNCKNRGKKQTLLYPIPRLSYCTITFHPFILSFVLFFSPSHFHIYTSYIIYTYNFHHVRVSCIHHINFLKLGYSPMQPHHSCQL